MKKIKTILRNCILLLLTLFLTESIKAQDEKAINAIKKLIEKKSNFFTIQKQIHKLERQQQKEKLDKKDTTVFENELTELKRWEYFWGQRTYPSGNFPNANYRMAAMEKVKSMYRKSNSTNGNSLSNVAPWQELGPKQWYGNVGTHYAPGVGRSLVIREDPNDLIFI